MPIMTQFVIERVLQHWREWAALGIRLPVAANLSPRSLLDRHLPDVIRDLLDDYQVPPSFLKLELTESFMVL